jgi:uncharacterized protein YbaR (Trm112 family)
LTVHILKVEENKLKDPKELATELITHQTKGVLSELSLGPVHNLSGDKMVDERLTAARKAFAALSKRNPSPDALRPLVDYFYGIEILEGVLRCEKCHRFYPIGSRIASIPELLPDGGRDREADLAFLRKYQKELPEALLRSSKPYALESKA